MAKEKTRVTVAWKASLTWWRVESCENVATTPERHWVGIASYSGNKEPYDGAC